MDCSIIKLSDFAENNDLKAKKPLNLWNKDFDNKKVASYYLSIFNVYDKEKTKEEKLSSINKSTLSLHIAAYENSTAAANSDGFEEEGIKMKGKKSCLIKKCKNPKQIFVGSAAAFTNPFEFPRQQENQNNEPEVVQFKANQGLANPNLYESLPAGLNNAQPPPPPPAKAAAAAQPPPPQSPAPGNQLRARKQQNQNNPPQNNNNNNNQRGGGRGGRGRGGGVGGGKQNIKPQKRPSRPAAPQSPSPNVPKKPPPPVVPAPAPIGVGHGNNGKIEDEMKSGQQQQQQQLPLQKPQPQQHQQQQSSVQQKSDVSYHFAGVDREYQEDQTEDPAYDLNNDMEHNDIYAIRMARERGQRKKKEKYACLAIIVMVIFGAILTLTSGILIAVDLSS
uniref:Uncharacterized protein n=1 Tax=Panagrolaimus sp. ES5 TaxID=591445 RepID=A0AC34FIK3_9BILA